MHTTSFRKLLLFAALAPQVAAWAQPVADIPATLTDGQYYYTLYSAPVALDFTATTGVEAYVATKKQLGYGVETPTVTLLRTDRVPANTGLLLRATQPGSVTLTEAVGDVKAPRRNYLVAVAERTDEADLFIEGTDDDGTAPALLAVADDGTVGFQRSTLPYDWERPTPSSDYTRIYHRGERFLEAGTAYLKLDDGKSELYFGNTTGALKLLQEAEPVTQVDGIGAAVRFTNAVKEDTEVLVNLTDAVVTFADAGGEQRDEVVVLEDATGGQRLRLTGLGGVLDSGDVVSGQLSLYVAYSDIANELLGDETTAESISLLTVVQGTAEPTVIDDDNVEDYIEDYEWRLVRFTDVSYQAGSDTEDPRLYIDILGDNILVFDILQTNLPNPKGEHAEAVGYLYTLFGNVCFQPLDYIVNGQSTGVAAVRSRVPAAPATVYDLQGRRVSQPNRGLYIINGRKVLVKGK